MIEFKNVKKKYNGHYVLKNVNIMLPRYGLVIINGPSGCGKTTLLNILSSLLDFEGDVSFDGKRYKEMKNDEKEVLRNKKIGFVFQDYKLFEFETVSSNILLSINMCSVDKDFKKEKRVEDLLSLVDLSNKKNELVSNLSGGEKQRVAIARAISNSPSLLLADEPTGNLDEKNSEIVMELLKKISSSSLIVVVTHDEELTNKYADRIIKMKDGKIVSDRYQNRNKHNDYLPILKLKYDDKKRTLPFKFLLNHTRNSIKRRKWRTAFITASTSLGLIGIGLSSTLGEIISENLYRSYSSVLDSDKIVVSSKNPNIEKDIISSASLDEVQQIASYSKGIKNIGVYYWNTEYLFASNNFMSLDNSGSIRQFSNFNSNHINEFASLDSYSGDMYPYRINELMNDEIVLSMPMLAIDEICYQLQIPRTITSLSNYIEFHDVTLNMNFSNDSWEYSVTIPLRLRGFILSTQTLIYHSNKLWNQYIFEEKCRLPFTYYINVNSSHPWDLVKSYYFDFSNGRDEFLINNRFSLENDGFDFELFDKKYYPILFENEPSYLCSRVGILHRTNKDDIPAYIGDYCKKASNGIYEVTYGSDLGYSIYEQSLLMGFSKSTYLGNNEQSILDVIDETSYIKYEDSLNVKLPDDMVEGHFSKSGSDGLVFDPHFSLITGREPANFQEILVSDTLINRLKISDPINKIVYLSFPVKEDLLSNGYLSREYVTVGLKIVGITNSAKLSISHKESWSILFFQTMLGVSTFELRINNLAIRIKEGMEDAIINKINRAFPHLSVVAPLKDVKNSVNKICSYIEIIMLVVSIASVIIASIVLFICNYLHYMEVRKDIGLVRCLGVKEKESRKFVYCHSFLMTGLSFIFSSIELLVISIVLSKALSTSLHIGMSFVFNPLSFVYMLIVALAVSLISSFLISRKISKIPALDCL